MQGTRRKTGELLHNYKFWYVTVEGVSRHHCCWQVLPLHIMPILSNENEHRGKAKLVVIEGERDGQRIQSSRD